MTTVQKLRLSEINILAGTQSRAELNQATVDEYADALRQGTEFPPVVVFSDGAAHGNWLADGFHRYHGHRIAGLVEINCEVRVGTLRDAKLFAAGANGTHGLRRTNADKRQAVSMMLSDLEWKGKPETWLADTCKVSRTLVRSMLEELHLVEKHDAVRTVERNGKTYEMNTAQIGKSPSPTPAPTSVATPPAVSPSTLRTAEPAPSIVKQPAGEPAPVEGDRDGEDLGIEPDPFDSLMDDYSKVVTQRDDLMAKVEALEAHVALLTCADLAAEVHRLVESVAREKYKFEQLSGRNKQLQETARTAQLAKSDQDKFIAAIRAALGVEDNRSILPAITARRAA